MAALSGEDTRAPADSIVVSARHRPTTRRRPANETRRPDTRPEGAVVPRYAVTTLSIGRERCLTARGGQRRGWIATGEVTSWRRS